MNESWPSIEDECVEATLAHQRMSPSVNSRNSANLKPRSVDGKFANLKEANVQNTTGKPNDRNPGYHDLKAFNKVKAINFMLHIFDERQRVRNQKTKKRFC